MSEPSGRVVPLLFDSSPLLSSAVYAGPDGTLLVGLDAERAAAGHPAGLERNPKRRIDEGSVWLADRAVAVVDLIAALLVRIAGEARRVAGRAPDEVALTHPATWGPVRLATLADAASRAGLAPVRFVPEPVAAASYFAATSERRLPTGRCLVVYDLGAGTFDATVLRAEADGFATLATAGLDDVGGLDIDAVVVAHARAHTGAAAAEWRRLDWPQNPADQRARQQLWAGAKAAKEQLSRHPAVDLHVPLVDAEVRLTREEFDALARPHLDRTAARTLAVLQEAAVPPEMVGGVYLVGGSSRLPLAATVLHRTLRIAPTVLDHPELVVAEGALYGGTPDPVSLAMPVSPAIPVSPPMPPGPDFTVSAPIPTSVTPPTGEPAVPVATAYPVQAPPPAQTPPPVRTPVRQPAVPDTGGGRRGSTTGIAAGFLVILVLVAIVVSAAQLFGDSGGSGAESGPSFTPEWSWSASGTQRLHDDFDSRDLAKAWHPVTGVWSIGDSAMTGFGDVAGWPTVMLDLTLPPDVVVHYRTKMGKDGESDLLLRGADGRYVRVFLDEANNSVAVGDGHLNGRGGADGGDPVTTEPHEISNATWYDVTVEAKGRHYSVTVDGYDLVNYDDARGALSRTGGLGFASNGAGVTFDDVTVVAV
ncbi:Hsp70 family protein [Dactylosporangium darangshiense]|uniref:Hsp70 family protein n=1 Tax=Dactylosporangium darangshiense TaxID=579108 RepID=UPI0031E986B4